MICYRDITFCYYLDCKNKECKRRFEGQIEKEYKEFNNKWLEKLESNGEVLEDFPICSFAEKPGCYE